MELADSTFFQRCDVISHQVGHADEDGAVTFAGQLVLDWNGWLDPTILALPLDDLASDRLLSDSGSRQIRASGTPIFTLALAPRLNGTSSGCHPWLGHLVGRFPLVLPSFAGGPPRRATLRRKLSFSLPHFDKVLKNKN